MTSNRHPEVRARSHLAVCEPRRATAPLARQIRAVFLRGSGAGKGLRHSHLRMTGQGWSAPMEYIRVIFTVAPLLLAVASPTVAQPSVESFYKDKRVRMLVGYGVGTGNDLYLRLLARHIGKYIPGKPTMVPENMPGAGGIVMFNHLYNVAARDGTVLAHPSRSLVTEPLYGNAQARYDAQKFGWLGSMNRDVATCIAWGKSGVRTIEDAKRREVAVGSTGSSAESNYFAKLLNAVLGTKFKTVLGYPDSGAVGIAMERGEIDGYCSFTWAAIKSARPQ